MNKEIIRKVIENLSNDMMSDLELYQINFDSKLSMMELFFDNYFRKIEGITCACDKSHFTVKKK